MKKSSNKGFTLAELLIVVAIIGVLVAISIPIFTNQLERSKDAVAVANIRNAYGRAMAEYITCTIKDSRNDGGLNSYYLKDGERIVGTVNFRNGRIAQICIVNVELPSGKRNNWSGLADSFSYHDKIRPDDYGDPGFTRKHAMIVFNFDDNGSGHTGAGVNWDGIDAEGSVTSVTITDTPDYIMDML